MKTYDITIQAVVTKTIQVEAEDSDAAIEAAHQEFSILNDDAEERYEQNTLNVQEADSQTTKQEVTKC